MARSPGDRNCAETVRTGRSRRPGGRRLPPRRRPGRGLGRRQPSPASPRRVRRIAATMAAYCAEKVHPPAAGLARLALATRRERRAAGRRPASARISRRPHGGARLRSAAGSVPPAAPCGAGSPGTTFGSTPRSPGTCSPPRALRSRPAGAWTKPQPASTCGSGTPTTTWSGPAARCRLSTTSLPAAPQARLRNRLFDATSQGFELKRMRRPHHSRDWRLVRHREHDLQELLPPCQAFRHPPDHYLTPKHLDR